MIVVFARYHCWGHDFAYFGGPGGGLEFVGLRPARFGVWACTMALCLFRLPGALKGICRIINP